MQDNLVSVLTPVYNGALYLEECIRSVLRQTYGNFQYVIVDNCSTDESFEIATAAAAGDGRISVVRNDDHVGPIQNWNRALGQVSQQAKYIKFVHADDWLFDTCIEKMVNLAEENNRVGLVSAYRLEEDQVSLDHLPTAAPSLPGTDAFVMDGREVARSILLEHASVLGSPTAVLYRTSAIGKPEHFFATKYLHSDKEAALRLLENSDFGFIRQILTFTRRHNESVTSLTNTLDTRRQENLLFLKSFGQRYLSDDEFQFAWEKELRRYYRFLARKVGTAQGNDFWNSHKQNLAKAGSTLDRARLIRIYLRRWMNPARAVRELRQELSRSDDPGANNVHGFLDLSREKRSAKD